LLVGPRGRGVAGAGVGLLVGARWGTTFKIASTISRIELVSERGADVGAVIMLGTLFGLIVLIFGLVLRFDPEARRSQGRER
jgi:hypothetical protein